LHLSPLLESVKADFKVCLF